MIKKNKLGYISADYLMGYVHALHYFLYDRKLELNRGFNEKKQLENALYELKQRGVIVGWSGIQG